MKGARRRNHYSRAIYLAVQGIPVERMRRLRALSGDIESLGIDRYVARVWAREDRGSF